MPAMNPEWPLPFPEGERSGINKMEKIDGTTWYPDKVDHTR